MIVDPPAFAKSRREVRRRRARLRRAEPPRVRDHVSPAARSCRASCSYNVRAADFQSFLARAAHLAGQDAWLEEMRGAGADHPVLLTLPETSYLKCAFVRV